ncbi:DedA family protein [Smaragdicoccus niigatensis]|uniref:DedA family protein n=1 Tax=Smaragdicoccus niigatensis TaxID=359359 RepID=UPI000368C39C|nr:VTT domain-containing protein [Smaragdicoccus niigatensis]
MTHLLDPIHLLTGDGPFAAAVLPAILAMVFIETGLLFPFLPGDSLLFTGGLLAHTPAPPVPLWVLLIAIPIAAIAGDNTSYFIGRKLGPALFNRPDSRFFKQSYITESHQFFEKHGPKAIVLARFVPIVRTFSPVLAGASHMTYRKFLTYDIIGGVLWGAGVTLAGYLLGQISFVAQHVEGIFILIVVLSVVPAMGTVIKRLRGRANDELEPATT